MGAGEYAVTDGDAFVWKSERAEVTLSQARDGWIVEYAAVGRLLGPPQVLHHEQHREARLAAWDVFSRVQSASRDDAVGMRVALSAAQWIKSRPRTDESGDVDA